MLKCIIMFLYVIVFIIWKEKLEAEKSKKRIGIKPYYNYKIESLQLVIMERNQNLRRLQAQRNELNAKGTSCITFSNDQR